jgi:hypothetical protein
LVKAKSGDPVEGKVAKMEVSVAMVRPRRPACVNAMAVRYAIGVHDLH